MFDRAGMKLGLDKAVLSRMEDTYVVGGDDVRSFLMTDSYTPSQTALVTTLALAVARQLYQRTRSTPC